MSWTLDRDAELTRLWNQGYTASQIAVQMGGATRNAVIGRARRIKLPYRNIHRVGLSTRDYGQDDRTAKTRSVFRLPPKPPAKKPSPVAQMLRSLPKEPLPAPDTMVATVSMNGLEKHHCRAPIGPDGAKPDEPYFCGKHKTPGTSYCETHARLYLNVPDPNKPKTYWTVGHGKIGGVIRSETEKHKNAKEFAES